MFPVDSGIAIDRANMRWFDISALKLQKLDEAFAGQGTPAENIAKAAQFAQHTEALNAAVNPAYQPYAVVRVGGKVVAEIDNHGFAEMSNAAAAKLGDSLPGTVNGKTGPLLAEARAELIAERLGGRVEKSASALTQSQFEAVAQPGPAHAASVEALQKAAQAQTAFTAQQMAQASDVTADPADQTPSAEGTEPGASDPVKKFLEYMQMTPEERYYEAILREKGLTKEQMAALPPEERERIEREIKEEIVERMAVKSAELADKADA